MLAVSSVSCFVLLKPTEIVCRALSVRSTDKFILHLPAAGNTTTGGDCNQFEMIVSCELELYTILKTTVYSAGWNDVCTSSMQANTNTIYKNRHMNMVS